MRLSTVLLVVTAVLAFAGNSLIARVAIGQDLIAPGPFSVIRLLAGALVLLPLLRRKPRPEDIPGALALLAYVIGFSFAYRELSAATGALILFAAVQFTIIAAGLMRGERLGGRGFAGLTLAGGGIVWLLLPNAATPAALPTFMMAAAGMAWGAYTIIGRQGGDAMGQTARSFVIAALLSVPFGAIDPDMSTGRGIALAAFAGVVTSAFGYVLWYKVSPRLSLGVVSSSQLATPIVAALAATILLDEPVSWRLALAGAAVLGGIALTISPVCQKPEPRTGSSL